MIENIYLTSQNTLGCAKLSGTDETQIKTYAFHVETQFVAKELEQIRNTVQSIYETQIKTYAFHVLLPGS